MITFDKKRNAWNFKECNEDERAALMELAEAYWASMMAAQIAKQMMAEAEDPLGGTVSVHGAN